MVQIESPIKTVLVPFSVRRHLLEARVHGEVIENGLVQKFALHIAVIVEFIGEIFTDAADP